MKKMDVHCRNEYLRVIRENYFKARTRKEKTQLLEEYCRNTGQSRNYVIWQIHKAGLIYSGPKQRKRRKEQYDSQVKSTLAKIWEIFNYPCGQMLKLIIEVAMNMLRELGEIEIPDEVALKLRMISSATIDRKLKHQRKLLHLSRSRGGSKPGYLLEQNIPIRLTQRDTSKVGYVEAHLVVHCGSSSLGEYANIASRTEASSGWWDNEAIMGKSQEYVFGH